MVPGQVYAVSVTLQNTGTTTWTSANLYKLGTQNPQDNTLWTGSTRRALPNSVAPGQNVTFEFNVTAPATPGTYNFQWKMLEGPSYWFGAQSTNVAVNVTPSSPDANVFFIHTDHLNTPRLVANSSGATVWRWDQQEPFGVNAPDENPSSLGAFEFPLRFPGQYADTESNLFYNFFRDYDPGIGRYLESDPLGVAAGLNTYIYSIDPLAETDPLGLKRTGAYGSGQSVAVAWPPAVAGGRSSGVCGADNGPKFEDEWIYFGATWNFQKACKEHDYCYTRGCKPRSQCDVDFYNGAKSECDKIPPSSALGFARVVCGLKAGQYYAAVVVFGSSHYNSKGCIGCPQ